MFFSGIGEISWKMFFLCPICEYAKLWVLFIWHNWFIISGIAFVEFSSYQLVLPNSMYGIALILIVERGQHVSGKRPSLPWPGPAKWIGSSPNIFASPAQMTRYYNTTEYCSLLMALCIYMHEDSCLRIIHKNLKTKNVLWVKLQL